MGKMKEAGHNIVESLKIVHNLDRAIIPLMIIKSILNAVNPFAAILLSSMVIDKLTAGVPIQLTLQLTSLGVVLIFLLTLASSIVKKYDSVHKERCYRLFNTKVGEKVLEMDYPQLESPRSHELRQRIQDDNNWGAGIYSAFYSFDGIARNFFSLVIAIVILVPLFLNSSFLIFGGLIYFLAFVIGITAANVLFQTKYINQCNLASIDKISQKSKLFSYLLFGGGLDYKAGKDIRIYNAQGLIRDYVEERGFNLWKRYRNNLSLTEGLGSGVSGAVNGLIEGGAYLLVAMQAASGALSFGAVIKYAASLYRFSTALSDTMTVLGEFSITAKRQQSSIAFFNIPDVLYKGTLPVEKRDDNEYEIEFRKVAFKYPGSEGYALKNLSIKFRIGERLAVVGMNGSGKTTMIKLLCRLYDPTEGQILLNGIDIKKYDYNEYLNIFSVVFQDFKLFSFSLGQNVATSVNYDKEKVSACLRKAGLSERLEAMSKGTETALYRDFEEDGVEISGGEAQKIALARALYKDAPFIILDEPTAALDPIAEYEIYSKFNEIVGDKTAIYISHRLSSCRFCDDIAVFHEGQLIQRGNHETLIQDKGGKYYELWNAQAQYYEV